MNGTVSETANLSALLQINSVCVCGKVKLRERVAHRHRFILLIHTSTTNDEVSVFQMATVLYNVHNVPSLCTFCGWYKQMIVLLALDCVPLSRKNVKTAL